jgi:hypothetical protein
MKGAYRNIRRIGVLIAIAYSGWAPAAYTLIPFDYPGSTQTAAFGINNRLQVAGGAVQEGVGFIYDFANKTFSILPPGPSGFLAGPVGLNDVGMSTGSLGDPSGASGGAFIFDGSTYTVLNHGSGAQGRGINNAGTVTGFSYTGADTPTMWFYDPPTNTFTDVAMPGAFKTLQGINSAGDMVGTTAGARPGALFEGSDSYVYSFVRSASGFLTFFRVNGLRTRARSINDFGQVVGNFDDVDGITKGFIITAPTASSSGGYVSVSVPATEYLVAPGYAVFANGINNAGFISGLLADASGTVVRGFVAVPSTPLPGVWWNKSEPGSGLGIDYKDGTLIVEVYSYLGDGSSQWYLAAGALTNNVFTATLDKYTGGPCISCTYQAATASGNDGTITIMFTSPTTGAADLPGGRHIAIERYFAAQPNVAPAAGIAPAPGVWWNKSEPGSGLGIDYKDGTLIVEVYSYLASGGSQWYLAAGPITNNVFTATLDKYTGGQCISCAYKAPSLSGNDGTITITFTSPTTGAADLPGGRHIQIQRYFEP